MAEIKVSANGPYVVKGPVDIETADGVETVDRIALCRCGQSSNKPRCDGTHNKVSFEAPGA